MSKKQSFPLLQSLLRCRYCGVQLEVTTNGRQRKFCCDSHRNMYNKKQSTSELAKHYKSLATDFFAIINAEDRQIQLEEWAIKYAYWCNGEMPQFTKTKEALLNAFIPRDPVKNESGKSIHDRLIALLREKVPSKEIYNRLAVVRAYGMEPSASLLSGDDAEEVSGPQKPAERSQKPSQPAPVVDTPKPAKPVQASPIASKADDDFDPYMLAAFAGLVGDEEPVREEPTKPEETVQPVAPIDPRETTMVRLVLNNTFSGQLVSERSLFAELKTCAGNQVEVFSRMLSANMIQKVKNDKGTFYRLANNEDNVKAEFWADCLRYAARQHPTADSTIIKKKAMGYFHGQFSQFPSRDITEVEIDLNIDPSVANVRQIMANFDKLRRQAA